MADRIVYKDGWFLFAVFGVAFSLDMFQLYAVNGFGDFLTLILLGSVDFGSNTFLSKVGIYLLLVPVFIVLKIASTLWRYPEILTRGYPRGEYFSVLHMDHFANAVFLMSLPAAFQQIGAWTLSIAIIVTSLFVLPRFVSDDMRPSVRFVGVIFGIGMQAWLTMGTLRDLLGLPAPGELLPAWVLVELSTDQIDLILTATQSVVFGPLIVPVLGVSMASIFASRAMEKTPVFAELNPERTPWFVIVISSFLGTVAYLAIRYLVTGTVIVFPY